MVEDELLAAAGKISTFPEEDKFQKNVEVLLSSLSNLLSVKNKRYGNSALSPLHIFSPTSNGSNIESRIDEKLSRIKQSTLEGVKPRINDVADLMGYLTLLCLKLNYTDFTGLID